MNLWNEKNLQAPPVTSYKAKNHAVDIGVLHQILSEAVNTFTNQSSLDQEAALLSRCIYRMKMKFRSDKGLKAMEKMNRCLLQYLRMNTLQTIEMFCSVLPQKYARHTYLPTLNMLHYLLVRLQGLSKLLVRLVESSKIAGQFLDGRVGIGHLWKVAFICFSVVSRIFVLAKDLLRFCCKFYARLRPFGNVLNNAGVDWLPCDYHLPDDLETWLNVDWLDKEEAFGESKERVPKVPTVFDIVASDSDVEFCGEYMGIDDDCEVTDEYVVVKEDDQARADKTEEVSSMLELEDVGEVVRPSTGVLVRSKKNRKKIKRVKTVGNQSGQSLEVLVSTIKTLQDLKDFDTNFEVICKTNLNVFREATDLQCKVLRKTLKKWITKAKKQKKKHQADSPKINLCINKAREELMSSWMQLINAL